MNTFDYSSSANIFVHFHIGRGGRSNNQGHKEYRGTGKPMQDLMNEYGFIISEDENGKQLPDSEWKFVDGGDNVILEGREAIEAPTGILEWDGEYNTDIVEYLSECSDEEYHLIIDAYNRRNYVDEDVIDYACQAIDGLHAKKIIINGDSIDVHTQYKTVTFERDTFTDFDDAKEELTCMGFPERDAETIACAMSDECWFDED